MQFWTESALSTTAATNNMPKQSFGGNFDNDHRPKWVTPAIWILSLTSAALVAAGRNNLGPPFLERLGKSLFWTEVCFLPLLVVNRSVIHKPLIKRSLIIMTIAHVILLLITFNDLQQWSFVVLTPVGFAEFGIFCFLLVRLDHD